jgi:GNAT superfamily N-acetyltransferase
MPSKKSASPIRVREIRTSEDPALASAHAMLRREFPRSEMLPVRDWRNAMRERVGGLWTDIRWHLFVAERDGAILAAASGSYLGNVNVGIIGYVAVRPSARSSGLGPRMRRALQRRFELDARELAGRPLQGIVGEVREDNPWLRTLVRRDGAIALDFDYVQPALSRRKDPVPLIMYYQPMQPRTWVDTAFVRRLLYTMWRRMYRIAVPLSRPEFKRMLKSLAGRRRHGQRALAPLGKRRPHAPR